MSDVKRSGPPQVGETWRQIGTGREVLIEDVNSRFVYVRNTRTGRPSRMDVWTTFRRGGKTGWDRVSEVAP